MIKNIYNSTEIKLEYLKDLQTNIQNLIDKRNEAERTAIDEYSSGYVDGLTMAIAIIDGLTE
jgi:hypothetical protein